MRFNALHPFWSYGGLGIIFTVGALMVLMRGRVEAPSPVRILNPTVFAKPEEIGAVIFRRFWTDINRGKFVVVGLSTRVSVSANVWAGFLAVAREHEIPFFQVYAQDHLISQVQPLHPTVQLLNWEAITKALSANERVLVFVRSNNTTWNEVQRQVPLGLAIFEESLPVSPEIRAELQKDCELSASSEVFLCRALKAISSGRKNRIHPDQMTAVIEKYESYAHLLFIHVPATNSP